MHTKCYPETTCRGSNRSFSTEKANEGPSRTGETVKFLRTSDPLILKRNQGFHELVLLKEGLIKFVIFWLCVLFVQGTASFFLVKSLTLEHRQVIKRIAKYGSWEDVEALSLTWTNLISKPSATPSCLWLWVNGECFAKLSEHRSVQKLFHMCCGQRHDLKSRFETSAVPLRLAWSKKVSEQPNDSARIHCDAFVSAIVDALITIKKHECKMTVTRCHEYCALWTWFRRQYRKEFKGILNSSTVKEPDFQNPKYTSAFAQKNVMIY